MVEQAECIHFWEIETAAGPRSSGKCKYCNITKVFRNTVEVTYKFQPGNIPKEILEAKEASEAMEDV